MGYLVLPFLFILLILVLFCGYTLIVVWRRLRLVEAELEALAEAASQGGFLLHEYIAELEEAGDRVIHLVRERERELTGGGIRAAGGTEAPQEGSAGKKEAAQHVQAPEDEEGRLRRRVAHLAEQGESVHQIARMLRLGVGEVQVILGLSRLNPQAEIEEKTDA